MAENLQDEILVFEDCEEFNISYPVTVTRWEIKQVQGLNKQYLQVYFQKLIDSVKAFQLNIACYSAFGNEEKMLTGISVQDVDKKGVEFSEVIPLDSDVRKVEVYFSQCFLTDGTTLKTKERRRVVNSFVPFNDEDRAAAQSLLPNAKGYPIEKGTHWFCTCGAVYSSEHDNCIKCGKSKKEIFSLVTSDEVEQEKEKKTDELRKKSKVRRKRIKILSMVGGILALLSILFGILFSILFPYDSITVDGINYRKQSSGYSVTGYNHNKSEVVIPAKIRGLSVTSIGYDAFGMSYNSPCELESVSLPNTIASIGERAFAYCKSLTSVVIPNSVTNIGKNAFKGCNNLTEISVPFIGNSENKGVFGSIFGEIQTADANDDIPISLKTIHVTGGRIIGSNAFMGCDKVMNISIPSCVTSISNGAFAGCKSLEKIVIPESVVSIGNIAFNYCYNLKRIIIPNSVTQMGEYVFSSCNNLTIYCESNSKPSDWNEIWNSSNCPVVWGYEK